ncbi:Endonuclease/Exonuclease/phosphatase family protein [Gimesia panareensis]|uniref:Endonuclease/Exonuclease/phosphatase family protein n=1 Tax=Gimesia panareensis TaxID=2527978 RepID=A0A518FRY9_9PLAN|nr:endonuclease/exonuclease/phosphatase family protein [Gimesia panareensis]QDV19108.1 Endonuclease/Exonuclease/phosphatase family protein [Gimesia panareensis]
MLRDSRLIACVIALLVFALPDKAVFGQQPTTVETLNRPLRVLTANIWNYSKPYQARMKLLREQIETLEPDVIGFQEAGWTPGEEHQVKQLLKGLNYYIEHEADGADTRERRLLDVAVASRWPLKRRALHKLPGSGKALLVEIEAPLPVGRLQFVSTFGTTRWQFDRELNRERDAVALDQFIRENCDRQGFPPIIAGDFDATPYAACMRYLRGLQSLDGHSTHYYDAWEAAGNQTPGYTWTTKNPYAKQTTEQFWHLSDHHRRIDYILIGSPHHYRGYARVVSARVVLNQPQGKDWPSDHLGVFTEIAVKP